MPRGLLIVVSGPSGVGKNTVLNQLLAKKQDLFYSISATTRAPRNNEVDGVNYYFITKEEFIAGIENNRFLEWAEVYGQYYGTPRDKVEEKLNAGYHVVLDIDIQGAAKIRQNSPEAVLIFLLPPSIEELKQRLVGRRTENAETLKKRLAYVHEELAAAVNYDYFVVNDRVESACAKIEAIIIAEQCRRNRFDFTAFKRNFLL
ncbi:MAG TPA: guanylate kinase [Firmicutes bacterium]|jgi:guanylate kinase|nr:guanylate kinase [Bacillota bacterium]HOQ24924.1 guanylate kinase [Bacillota bacterium]HPT68304.1 guanylate kinase [Bacillota bacterium]